MTTNYFETIHASLLSQPDRVCLVWPAPGGSAAQSYTGRAVLDGVGAYREQLLTQGVRPGATVLLAVPVSFELICALLAIMAVGAMPVLPPAAASPLALAKLVRRLGIQVAVVGAQPSRTVRWVARLLGVRVSGGTVKAANVAPWTACPVLAEQAALISHSSGSTGTAKTIRRSHQVLLAQHEAIKAAFPPWAGQRDFPLFPNILLHNLAAGVTSVLPAVPWANLRQLNPGQVVAQLTQEQVQTLTGNVFYFKALLSYLRRHPVPLPAVVAIGVGGSPVPEPMVQELRQRFPNATVHVIYGSSEAEPIAVRRVAAATNPLAGYCVGVVQPGLEWRIDPIGLLKHGLVQCQAVGELWVRGAHVAAAPGRWLRTGDYGYVAQGQLFLTGRQGNERLHQGMQHYQLEHLLYHLPGVERVAVRSDATGFTVFVQGEARREDVRELLAKNCPLVVCLAVHQRRELPVDARHHSKILYDQLR